MDKPQLNYNEYLRYTFAGGFGVLTYLYLNPEIQKSLFNDKGTIKDSLLLIVISLLLGSFLYAIHRAFLYPICLKINFVILRLSKKIISNSNWWSFIFGQKEVKDQDFRRWKQRDNPKSFAKNLFDWSAQIHFLYCCVWAMIASWFLTFNEIQDSNILIDKWLLISLILFLISLRNHYKSLLYDLDIEKYDIANKTTTDKRKVKTIELKVETQDD